LTATEPAGKQVFRNGERLSLNSVLPGANIAKIMFVKGMELRVERC
jgi:hypothetical protein